MDAAELSSKAVLVISKDVPSGTGMPVSSMLPLPSTDPAIFITVFKNNGASLDIAITLYLAGTDTNSSRSCTFFNSKKVSSSILFLSAEGKLIHTFPSSASYQRSIAIL